MSMSERELRERVESLEEMLARLENFLELTATYAVSELKRDYAEFTLKTLRSDLSRSATKQKNQGEGRVALFRRNFTTIQVRPTEDVTCPYCGENLADRSKAYEWDMWGWGCTTCKGEFRVALSRQAKLENQGEE